MDELSVNVSHLTKKFGDFIAVDDVSFQIRKGSIFGFLGPNGAGKSTTIRMLLGIIPPTSGAGSVLGYDIITESEKIRSNVGYMSQKFSLYEDLTVFENLDFFAGVFSIANDVKKIRIAEIIELTKLDGYETKMTSSLPRGIRQRLAFAVSLIHDPGIVFLDEPTGGVDPNLRRYFWDVIYDLSISGKTVMVTTHYMDEVERCDNICFIYNGRLIAQGSPTELKTTILKGENYQINTQNRFECMHALNEIPGLSNVFPSGNTVRFRIEPGGPDIKIVKEKLAGSCIFLGEPEVAYPDLEDVFVTLAETERS